MTAPRPRFVVTEHSGLDPTLWAGLGDATRLSGIADIPDRDSDCVYLLSIGEAQTLLQTHRWIPVLVVWAGPNESVPDAIARHPRVAGILDARCRVETVRSMLRSALALAGTNGDGGVAQKLERVLEIGRALASEKDLDTLLGLILADARLLTQADGASIYTRDAHGCASAGRSQLPASRDTGTSLYGAGGTSAGMREVEQRKEQLPRTPGAADREGTLYFRLWQNASVPGEANIEKRPVGESSIAGYVARTGEMVVLDDAYAIPSGAPYRFNPAFDQAAGYRTRSLLTVPLTNKAGDVVGVLQLVNRKHTPDARLDSAAAVAEFVRPFDAQDRAISLALAGQAGVALENSMLHAEIERLFEGFIKASVAAIEARDPTTAGHSFRVAEFTERLAMAVDRSDAPAHRDLRFNREALREIRYAALLHDFGKVGVREDVLVKAKKLHPHQLDQVQQRFKYARLSVAWQAYRRLIGLFEEAEIEADEFRRQRRAIEQQVADEHRRLEQYLHTVLRANEPTVQHASAPDELRDILGYRVADEEGAMPLLHEFEFSGLSLPKGSLSSEERIEIESHVSHTYSFLKLIPWTRDLARLPDFAYAHHEKLDGSGYPRGLRQDEIPVQARMLTISDIYDALTASDRPYKPAVPVERALTILESEARASKIDTGLLEVFIKSGAYRGRV